MDGAGDGESGASDAARKIEAACWEATDTPRWRGVAGSPYGDGEGEDRGVRLGPPTDEAGYPAVGLEIESIGSIPGVGGSTRGLPLIGRPDPLPEGADIRGTQKVSVSYQI